MAFTTRAAARAIGAGSLLVVVLAACGGAGASEKAATTTTRVGSTMTIEAGTVTVESAGAPLGLADADRDAVVETVRRYVKAATVDPLLGEGVGDLAPLLAATVGSGLTPADRAALVDEGLPESTGTVEAVVAPVVLTALADRAGAIDLVGAGLDVTVTAKTARGPVVVHRAGELILVRDGAAWRIESFRLLVDRSGRGLSGGGATTATQGNS
ncbi:MAG: hypothetical protein FJW88_14470 [Actinobacteria bacterium]|nr:hypothetical protein [Actinomycetota bacterium]